MFPKFKCSGGGGDGPPEIHSHPPPPPRWSLTQLLMTPDARTGGCQRPGR